MLVGGWQWIHHHAYKIPQFSVRHRFIHFYLIITNFFFSPPPNSSYIFIGSEEPLLADTLLVHNVMAPIVSYDYSTGTKMKVTTYSFLKNNLRLDEASGVMYATGSLVEYDCLQKGRYFVSK